MYAVIFKATMKKVDASYIKTAQTLREIAMGQYGCKDFISTSEGLQEITISYWESLDAIKAWKNNPLHIEAQTLGKSTWYESYQIEIVKVIDKYEKL
ncbi:MAG: antibiotic biosynthesis monooxygenase [Epsilonproteobacteria bacterium]|nr:antibiotic biosynthesis monooxygenase [Campylobacterota bacterium]